MKLLQLSSFDVRGGAAIAAMRLHQGLLAAGVDSEMLVQFKAGDDERVHGPQGKWRRGVALLRDTLEALPLQLYRQRSTPAYSLNWTPSTIARQVNRQVPDLVQLHWVNAGMLPPPVLRQIKKPLVWTMHDMWPFTGGCHHAGDCERYRQHCGQCPQLGSRRDADLSRWVLARKRRSWHGLSLTPVAPSQWLADCAAQSSLFGERDIRVIPNGLDLSRWRPVDAQQARRLLGLPDGPLLLFCAARGLAAPFKGGRALVRILSELYAGGRQFTFLLMGGSSLPAGMQAGFPVHGLGELHDDISKVLAYSAADVTLHSAEQENLPNTIAESLACGTPVVANAVGGIPEMIADRENGLLVQAEDHAAFAKALSWYLDGADRVAMSRAARHKAEASYDLATVSAAYHALYAELLGGRRGNGG